MKPRTILTSILTAAVVAMSAPAPAPAAERHQGVGTIKTIDLKQRRVELDHGPVKSIGWMGMTMFFEVEDRDLLEDSKIGDKVDFEFVKTKDGRFVITDIELKE